MACTPRKPIRTEQPQAPSKGKRERPTDDTADSGYRPQFQPDFKPGPALTLPAYGLLARRLVHQARVEINTLEHCPPTGACHMIAAALTLQKMSRSPDS